MPRTSKKSTKNPLVVKFRKNNKVRWRGKDDQGYFCHSGVVVRVKNNFITFSTKNNGVMTVSLDDGSFKKL